MSRNYGALGDAELIAKTKENDCEAFAELSVRYFWLIRSKARLFSGTSAPEKEDLYQEGFLGLYVAALSYRPDGGASFDTYAGLCLYRRMVSAVRNYSGAKNRLLNESLPLDSAQEFQVSSEETPEKLLEFRESFQQILAHMHRSLSPLERKVLSCYLNGYRRAEIHEKTGMTLKVFDNALHRVRNKLKNSYR